MHEKCLVIVFRSLYATLFGAHFSGFLKLLLVQFVNVFNTIYSGPPSLKKYWMIHTNLFSVGSTRVQLKLVFWVVDTWQSGAPTWHVASKAAVFSRLASDYSLASAGGVSQRSLIKTLERNKKEKKRNYNFLFTLKKSIYENINVWWSQIAMDRTLDLRWWWIIYVLLYIYIYDHVIFVKWDEMYLYICTYV